MVLDYKDYSKEQMELLNEYHENGMRKLKKICDPIISYKQIPQMYHDDLYDDAAKVLEESIARFDSDKSKFQTFLTGNIKRSFYDWTRDNTRGKRCNVQRDKNGKIVKDEKGKPIIIPNVSFDARNDDGLSVLDVTASDFNIETAIKCDNSFSSDGRAEIFIKNLSDTQKKIAGMIVSGEADFNFIKQELGLSDKEFNAAIKSMRDYENAKHLYRNAEININKEDITMGNVKSGKNGINTSYAISSIVKQMKKRHLRDDHVLQRSSGQWTNLAKSELISDILQDNIITPIIISEEIKNNLKINWIIDGKQRCTNIDLFINNGFAIAKNVTVYEISYQTEQTDEKGNVLCDDEGNPIMVSKICDIRGKRFSKLPEELQDKFMDYQVPVMLNLNCNKFQIAYDMSRFNRCRPMNKSQNGWTGMEENFAELVDNILKMQMFKPDCKFTSYTDNNIKSGGMRRMIVESIILSDYVDEYKENLRSMCEFLSDNANDATFAKFYAKLDRLSNILFDEMAEYFNLKDSYVWFALFSKFCETGLDDKRFVEFLADFLQSVHKEEYDAVSKKYSRKSKNDVTARLNYLTNCMYQYLSIEKEEPYENIEADIPTDDVTEKFVEDFCNSDLVEMIHLSEQDKRKVAMESLQMVDNVPENALDYSACMNSWLEEVKDSDDKVTREMIPALIGLCGYIFEHELEDEKIVNGLNKYLNSPGNTADIHNNLNNMIACVA